MEDAILREILIDDLIIFSVCCAGRAYTISRDELISRACRLCATLAPSLSPLPEMRQVRLPLFLAKLYPYFEPKWFLVRKMQ